MVASTWRKSVYTYIDLTTTVGEVIVYFVLLVSFWSPVTGNPPTYDAETSPASDPTAVTSPAPEAASHSSPSLLTATEQWVRGGARYNKPFIVLLVRREPGAATWWPQLGGKCIYNDLTTTVGEASYTLSLFHFGPQLLGTHQPTCDTASQLTSPVSDSTVVTTPAPKAASHSSSKASHQNSNQEG